MINTLVYGIPTTLDLPCRFLVRTFFSVEDDMYVTAVYYYPSEYDAGHNPYFKNKYEVMNYKKSYDSMRLHSNLCTHRHVIKFNNMERPNVYLRKELGKLHLETCQEILDGKYWCGEFAFL